MSCCWWKFGEGHGQVRYCLCFVCWYVCGGVLRCISEEVLLYGLDRHSRSSQLEQSSGGGRSISISILVMIVIVKYVPRLHVFRADNYYYLLFHS